MGFFDFLKSKKKKEEVAARVEKMQRLDDVDPAEINPPETRFTEEYREFLETLEADEPSKTIAADEPREAPETDEPCEPAAADEPCAAPEADEPCAAPETDEL